VHSPQQDPYEEQPSASPSTSKAISKGPAPGPFCPVHAATAVALGSCRLLFIDAEDLRRFGRKLRVPLAEAARQRRVVLERRRALLKGTWSGLAAAASEIRRRMSVGASRQTTVLGSRGGLLPIAESSTAAAPKAEVGAQIPAAGPAAAADLTAWDVRSLRQLVPTQQQAPSLVEIAAGGRPFPVALLTAAESLLGTTTASGSAQQSEGLMLCPPMITPGSPGWDWTAVEAANGGSGGAGGGSNGRGNVPSAGAWASSAGSSAASWRGLLSSEGASASPPLTAETAGAVYQAAAAGAGILLQPASASAVQATGGTGAAAVSGQGLTQPLPSAAANPQQQQQQQQAKRQPSFRARGTKSATTLGGSFVASKPPSYTAKRLANVGGSSSYHAAVVQQLAAVREHQQQQKRR